MALNRQMLFQQRDRQAIFLRETEPRAARPERPLLARVVGCRRFGMSTVRLAAPHSNLIAAGRCAP